MERIVGICGLNMTYILTEILRIYHLLKFHFLSISDIVMGICIGMTMTQMWIISPELIIGVC